MPYLDDDELEREARKLRVRLKADDLHPVDGITLLSKAQKYGVIQAYRRVNDEDMNGDLARFDPESRTMIIAESTFSDANNRNPRALFTVAHELGHACLHHTAPRARAQGEIARHGSLPREEAEANRFASAFLAPLHLAGNPLDQTIAEIAERFGISVQAAEIRKPILDRLYRRLHNIPRPLPPEVIRFLNKH